jgi:hypothetical protein
MQLTTTASPSPGSLPTWDRVDDGSIRNSFLIGRDASFAPALAPRFGAGSAQPPPPSIQRRIVPSPPTTVAVLASGNDTAKFGAQPELDGLEEFKSANFGSVTALVTGIPGRTYSRRRRLRSPQRALR